jgi:hypothetical protein
LTRAASGCMAGGSLTRDFKSFILPKATLTGWGVGGGDMLELTERGIRPVARRGTSHQILDELKRSLSLAVVSAYDEWTALLQRGDDGELFAAMLGRDDNSTRLRQSMPYVVTNLFEMDVDPRVAGSSC